MVFEFGFILVGLMQIVGYFIQGCTGFGCAVIAAPVNFGILGSYGGPYGGLMTFPTLVFLGIKQIKNVAWKDLFKILLLCAPGMVIGQYLASSMDANVAKAVVGGVIVAIALINIYKVFSKKAATGEAVVDTIGRKIYRFACLIIGGIIHGAFNIGGPFITIYTLEAIQDKVKFRDTMTWVWIILNTYNAIMWISKGIVDTYLLSALLVGLPFSIVGFVLGVKFLQKINKEQFLKVIYFALLFAGAWTMYGGLTVLL